MKFNREYKDKEIEQIIKSIIILIDTREKVNSHLKMYFKSNKIKYIEYKLNYGDYSFYIPKNELLDINEDLYFNDEIVIERKANAEEISNNFSNNRDRFKREFEKGKGIIRLLIEETNYSQISKGEYDTKFNNTSFIGSLHSFQETYNSPFFFIDKEFSGEYVYNTFKYYLKNQLKLNK